MEMLFVIAFLSGWLGLIIIHAIHEIYCRKKKETKKALRRDRDYWRHKAAVLETELSLMGGDFS